jgi:ClpP class serine protease
MIKKKKKKDSVTETEEFKELIRELRKQVPDEKKHLQDMLDEIISEKTVKTDER